MSDQLESLLSELEQFAAQNDQAHSDRSRKMLNITRETGQFFSVLVRAAAARRLLELGTSNGYSTLWLANAARANGGILTTVEQSDYKAGLARESFKRSGLDSTIALVQDDAGRVLERSNDDAFDFVFLDADRSQYSAWWPQLNRVLRPGGLLVADNATSHADQIAPLVSLLNSDPAYTVCIVPIGKGELLAAKSKR